MLLFAVTRRYCANTVLFKVHHKSYPNEVLTSYGISDDQNNCILTKLERFDYMHISKWTTQHFILFLSSGCQQMNGCRVSGFFVLSIRISVIMELPVVSDFNDIPIEVETHTLCYKSSTSSVWPTNSRIKPRCLNTVAGWTGFVWTISCKDQLIEARNAPFA